MNELLEILIAHLNSLKKALAWLNDSFRKCRYYDKILEYTNDEFSDLEALSARFSRTLDILTQKVYRSFDLIEYAESGTLIDAVNHAEKRGILNSGNLIRDMKNIRNQIAHEYLEEALRDIFIAVIKLTPDLITYCDIAIVYSEKLQTQDK